MSIWESGNLYCLITIDSIGFKKELADILRIKVRNILEVTGDKVMLCFSHCHSAPNMDCSEECFEMVSRNILIAVHSAGIDMHPVLAGWDNVEGKLLLIRVTAHCIHDSRG